MRLMLLAFLSVLLVNTARAGDWTGSYAGGQGGLQSSRSGAEGDAAGYGFHGGYDIDFGTLVLGGEIEFQRQQQAQAGGGRVLGNVGRVKLRAGRDFGPGLAYAILGGVSGDTSPGTETGVVYGLGLMRAFGNNLTIGGEALHQVFEDFTGSGADLRTSSFNVRVSFRF